MTLKVGMQYWILVYYQVYSNDDLWLILAYFTAESNLVAYAFGWEKGKTMDFKKLLSRVGLLATANSVLTTDIYKIFDVVPKLWLAKWNFLK